MGEKTLSDLNSNIHVFIPDTQIETGVPMDQLTWVGQYIVDRFAGRPNVTIIHAGDHATMASLSSYDKGRRAMEGKRYIDDIEAANEGWALLNAPFEWYNSGKAPGNKSHGYARTLWKPDRHITLGNHEDRITRAQEADPQAEGAYSLDHLDYARSGWTVHQYQEVLKLDGVSYSHYFINSANGRPVTGMIETRIKSIGTSFTQGHQQGLRAGMIDTVDGRRRGIVAGSCYLHNEVYRGPQGTGEWRGLLVCHEVCDGDYDLMEVSLNYLCRRYEGVPLDTFLEKKYPLIAQQKRIGVK